MIHTTCDMAIAMEFKRNNRRTLVLSFPRREDWIDCPGRKVGAQFVMLPHSNYKTDRIPTEGY